ncbi:MAG: glycosyltransferase family 2 protein, partial [Bacteroidota bacterium]
MKVSLITATYNSELTIKSCLDSISGQTYDVIEHVIIDGDSTDQTLSIIKEYKSVNPNMVVLSEPDNGIYDALNKGLNLVTGDIVGFVHSDDVLGSSQVINLIVKEFKDQNLDGVYGDLKYVDIADVSKTKRYWKSSVFTPSKLKNGWMPPHPTLFLRKEIYAKYGIFNTNLKIAADYEFVLRIFCDLSLRFTYIPVVLVLMREGGESNKTIKNIIHK